MTPEGLAQAVQSMLQALQSGQAEDARARAEAILKEVPGEPNASQVFAMGLLQRGQAAAALPHLEAADRAAPDHPHILNMLGAAHKQSGRRQEARQFFEHAIAADEDFIDARLNLAQLELDDGHPETAAMHFDAAIELQPQNAAAIAGRARSALLVHDNEVARDLAQRALNLQPEHTLAALTLAVARLRLKDNEGALAVAEEIVAREGVSPVNRAYAAGFAGDALDRMARFDEAFDFFTTANDLQADQFAHLAGNAASPFSPAVIARARAHLDAHGLAPGPDPGNNAPAPAFLLGFPRSGTTLLEQVLTAHPQVVSFGEQDTLASACGHFFTQEGGLEALDRVDEGTAANCRDRYWQEVEKLGDVPPGALYLDKLPLNTALLPAIARIFPDARILFAVRDPRDVILSCFQQRFGMNAAMYRFLKLENAAAYYDQVMGLAVAARDQCAFTLHEVRYERVVADLEGEARQGLGFLGLEWDPGVMDYREGARARHINTPSVAQVVEPIYTRSMGKWRNYERHLAPILSQLEPWAAHWGYTD